LRSHTELAVEFTHQRPAAHHLDFGPGSDHGEIGRRLGAANGETCNRGKPQERRTRLGGRVANRAPTLGASFRVNTRDLRETIEAFASPYHNTIVRASKYIIFIYQWLKKSRLG
jgi:hypothetical protein